MLIRTGVYRSFCCENCGALESVLFDIFYGFLNNARHGNAHGFSYFVYKIVRGVAGDNNSGRAEEIRRHAFLPDLSRYM